MIIGGEAVLLTKPELPPPRDQDVPAGEASIIIVGLMEDPRREEGVQDQDRGRPGQEASQEMAVPMVVPGVSLACTASSDVFPAITRLAFPFRPSFSCRLASSMNAL